MMLLGGLGIAFAGYGDPVAGVPDPQARQLAMWVNAVRTDPEAFEADYNAGGCSFYIDFSVDEQTPQAPYRVDQGLAEAAQAHTYDMVTNSWFAHDSSDGTPWDVRVGAVYPGWTALAENIALMSSPDPRDMVTLNWMCSAAGHRGAIMASIYEDLGAAILDDGVDAYGTLDFAAGAGGAMPVMRVGSHEPSVPTTSVTLRVDWTDVAAPDRIEVVVDGAAWPMVLEFGAGDLGVYAASGTPGAGACHRYFVEAERGGVVRRWPEDGSYGWGGCAFADTPAGWLDSQVGPTGSTQSTWVAGGPVTLTATGAVPGETVVFMRGTGPGPGGCPPALGGACVDLGGSISVLGQGVADASGVATLGFVLPVGVPVGATVHHQAAISDGAGNWTLAPALSATIQ